MYAINSTPENHGYTIRLVETSFIIENDKTIEISKTIATLAIVVSRNEADEVMRTLNNFISLCNSNNILNLNQFMYMPLKKY